MFRSHRNGFSMMEMLGVALVIGLLTAAAVWSVNGISVRNKEKLAEQRLETTAMAIRNYFVDRLTYPATLQELTTLTGSNGLPYLTTIPEDPFSADNSPIQYSATQKKLWSIGHSGPIELYLE